MIPIYSSTVLYDTKQAACYILKLHIISIFKKTFNCTCVAAMAVDFLKLVLSTVVLIWSYVNNLHLLISVSIFLFRKSVRGTSCMYFYIKLIRHHKPLHISLTL